MKNFKITFIALLIFYFCFHFIGPSIFYWLVGYKETYRGDIVDYGAMTTGFLLNFASVLLGTLLILVTPLKVNLNWKPKGSYLFLALSLFFTVGVMTTNLDYHEALKTLYTRSDYWVLGEMFFNLDFYLLFALTYSFNFITEISLVYVFLKIVAGARSAPLVLLHLGMVSFISPLAKRSYKKYVIYTVISFLFAVFGFNWATTLRNRGLVQEAIERQASIDKEKGITPLPQETPPNETKLLTQVQSAATVSHRLVYQIVGRISYLENTMLPIYFKNTNNERAMKIFKDKYSPISQLKIFINNIVPGDIFEFDVYPNQYYRSAFMDFTLKRSKEFYTSINLTLPVYFYMYSNFVVSVLATGILIWVYFVGTVLVSRIHPLLAIVTTAAFYPGLLTFFDFVMIGKALIVSSLSVGLFLILAEVEARCALRLRGVSKESVSDSNNA